MAGRTVCGRLANPAVCRLSAATAQACRPPRPSSALAHSRKVPRRAEYFFPLILKSASLLLELPLERHVCVE
eukprot:5473856-Pyramimonas_sp.AAC.1